MKVLLVSTNRERAPQPVIPLGVCLIASALQAAGFETRVLDLTFSRRPRRDLEQALRWRPDTIGLSVRNLDNGEYLRLRPYLPEVAEVARLCRRTGAPIILGGPAVSIAPAALLALTGADYAVVGEGEQVTPQLLRRLASGESPAGLPGVCSAGEVDGAAPARLSDWGSCAPGQPWRWLDLRRYLRWGSPMPLQSKRGCALKCIHCTYQLVEGARYRLRPPEAAVDEMAHLARRCGVRRFEVVDSTLNHPPRHALALCEAMARAGVGTDLYSMGLNPLGVSREMLGLMRRAGFRSVLCTPDSGSDAMLAALRKGFDAEQVARVAAWARAAGLPMMWSFLFGGPGESETTVRETIRFMTTALGPRDRILCTVGLRVYPGTELERIAGAEGHTPPGADLARPAFYFSPHITPARVMALLERSGRRPQMLYLETLQRAVVPWALRLRAAAGARGPMWAAVPLYNRLAGAARSARPRAPHTLSE